MKIEKRAELIWEDMEISRNPINELTVHLKELMKNIFDDIEKVDPSLAFDIANLKKKYLEEEEE